MSDPSTKTQIAASPRNCATPRACKRPMIASASRVERFVVSAWTIRRTRRSPCGVAASTGGKGRDAAAAQALRSDNPPHRLAE